ncbi:hypothetical protein [Methanobrevibacter sp.]|uniref:hypothetical protein n=1 Tax=Methanobrevibacter sp. TaxID=66852 RepID=UPI00388D6332
MLQFILFNSCSSSNAVVSHGSDLSKYKYVVFGRESTGDRELDDMIMLIQNEIANRLQVISAQKGLELLNLGELILSPNINVKSEKWDGGHTYITINFHDYGTSQSIAVIKSSGIGLTISHDQKIALNAIRKKLDKILK